MNEFFYSSEKNVRLLIALLKKYNIRKIIASPGATNVTFVSSVQRDDFFEIYSCVDERSAAYMACGMAQESHSPVLLSCTGATASRNYMPALTEAYYRKLPIIACTSAQNFANIGHLVAQVLDRNQHPSDLVLESVNIQTIRDENDLWDCEIKLNKVLGELSHRGGGPVHINLETTYSKDYSEKTLPEVRKIERFCLGESWPEIPQGRVGIFIGAHEVWSKEETESIEKFCESNNAVVFTDHTGNYHGKYRSFQQRRGAQDWQAGKSLAIDLLVHIGGVSGDYDTMRLMKGACKVWRVNPDGALRDTFHHLDKVFETKEKEFFDHYGTDSRVENTFWSFCCQSEDFYRERMPKDLPFSNIYIAQKTAHLLPSGSVLHLAILNTLRSWNYYKDIDPGVEVYCNVGAFGIDGCLSSLVGASLCNKERLYFGIIGDLSLFYDLNVLGNRHIGVNLRIMMINNGIGQEFKNYNHPASRFSEQTDLYMAAGGHFGNKSPKLIRHFVEDLGFDYITADSAESFEKVYKEFTDAQKREKPLFFEVFTDSKKENEALFMVRNIDRPEGTEKLKSQIKQNVKGLIGSDMTQKIKKMINK